MADLLISRISSGVAKVQSADPFDTLEIFRIDRSQWKETPQGPGIYLLYGQSAAGKLTVYIGMSGSNMRNRIRSHHVNKKKNWFGILFAVPITNPLLCQAIEAELIGAVAEAQVVDVVDNDLDEKRKRDIADPQIGPALEKVRDALELLLGSDIFTPSEEETTEIDKPIERTPFLARVYKGPVKDPRPVSEMDPPKATHAYVGAGLMAWGGFEGEEPDKRFRVLAGSQWRKPTLNPDATTYKRQVNVDMMQKELISQGVLDTASMKLTRDHVFRNWADATQVISGKPQYSGGYQWQRHTVDGGERSS